MATSGVAPTTFRLAGQCPNHLAILAYVMHLSCMHTHFFTACLHTSRPPGHTLNFDQVDRMKGGGQG